MHDKWEKPTHTYTRNDDIHCKSGLSCILLHLAFFYDHPYNWTLIHLSVSTLNCSGNQNLNDSKSSIKKTLRYRNNDLNKEKMCTLKNSQSLEKNVDIDRIWMFFNKLELSRFFSR